MMLNIQSLREKLFQFQVPQGEEAPWRAFVSRQLGPEDNPELLRVCRRAIVEAQDEEAAGNPRFAPLSEERLSAMAWAMYDLAIKTGPLDGFGG